ncbi:MAG: hypothetical protein K8T89_08420 [Planctomycetes bacterium]|nr:hypothetical protein [Planctomycetota bacterium]
MPTTNVPITIDPRAQERIDQLGLRKEFEGMLEHAVRTVPRLQRLEVSFPPSYDHQDAVFVTEAYGTWKDAEASRIENEFCRWARVRYPWQFYADAIFFARSMN